MDGQLLTGIEVDCLLRWTIGKAEREARRGIIPHIILPDGKSIRFWRADILRLIGHGDSVPIRIIAEAAGLDADRLECLVSDGLLPGMSVGGMVPSRLADLVEALVRSPDPRLRLSPARQACHALRVPPKDLADHVRRGIVPHILCGDQAYLNVLAVREALARKQDRVEGPGRE